MKKNRTLFFCGFTVYAAWSMLILAGVAEGASLHFEKAVFGHRAVPGEAFITNRFEAVNRSDQAVFIERVKSSCSCTVSEISNRVVLPGQIVSIEARFNYGERIGLHKKNLYVHTDDGSKPINLQMQVDIPDWLSFQRILTWTRPEWTAATPKKLMVRVAAPVSNGPQVLGGEALLDVVSADKPGGIELTFTPKAPANELLRLNQLFVIAELPGEGGKLVPVKRSLFVILNKE